MSDQTLPPYSGVRAVCAKCRSGDISTKYLDYGVCQHYNGQTAILGFEPNERLHRECDRCGYCWDEATA